MIWDTMPCTHAWFSTCAIMLGIWNVSSTNTRAGHRFRPRERNRSSSTAPAVPPFAWLPKASQDSEPIMIVLVTKYFVAGLFRVPSAPRPDDPQMLRDQILRFINHRHSLDRKNLGIRETSGQGPATGARRRAWRKATPIRAIRSARR